MTGLRRSLALSLLGKSPERPLELLQAIGDARRAGPTAPVPTTTPTTGTSRAAHHGAPGYGGLDEIIYHAPGHEDHLHVGEGQDPALMLRVIDEAQRLGLSVRENPYTDPVDPVHVKGSFHYRRFPGRYRGRRLGEGADISGNPRKLEQLYRELGGRTRY